MEDFADTIARLCTEKYTRLGKTGKPSEKEWTVLTGIVLKKSDDSLLLVVLATGTKCLGGSELLNTEFCERGCKLSDSHAEILARRAFLRYLYEQIDLLLSNAISDVFVMDTKWNIKIREGVSFHFFSSQTPCGDCSIFPKEDLCEDIAPPIKLRRCNSSGEKISESHNEKEYPRIKDIYRTGAKCVKSEQQDPHLSGINYHVVGPLRTKPGRGDPTLSLSCSDKMARWNFLGLQGSLLSILIPPIKIKTITIGGHCPFSLEAMERGLYKRFNKDACNLKIMQAKIAFVHRKQYERKNPCPSSIIWCAVQNRDTEIAVEGRKQGATKKKKGSHLLVSRRALFEKFLKICEKYNCFDHNIPRHPKKITYLDYKQWSANYRNLWNTLKSTCFPTWPSKPSYLQEFVL